MAKMAAATFAAENRSKEEALVNLKPRLIALKDAHLGCYIIRTWYKPRHHAGRESDKLLDPHDRSRRPLGGDAVVADLHDKLPGESDDRLAHPDHRDGLAITP